MRLHSLDYKKEIEDSSGKRVFLVRKYPAPTSFIEIIANGNPKY